MTTRNTILADLGNLLIQAQLRAWARERKNKETDAQTLAGEPSVSEPQRKAEAKEIII